VRIYLAATLPLLGQWLSSGEAQAETAHAVTPALREWYREADIDELEHAAATDAAAAALHLLAAAVDAPRRRVVVAADIDDAATRPASSQGRSVVTLAGPVPVTRWGSVLVDDDEARSVVVAAVAALAAAAAGDDDAQFVLDEATAHELGWYAVQEARYLVD
jgi:hypothetical protein